MQRPNPATIRKGGAKDLVGQWGGMCPEAKCETWWYTPSSLPPFQKTPSLDPLLCSGNDLRCRVLAFCGIYGHAFMGKNEGLFGPGRKIRRISPL
jgi:hypothetical protein